MLKKNILNLGHKFYVKEKEFDLKPKLSYFHNFGRELQKTIVRLEISSLEFVKMQSPTFFWDWNLRKLLPYLK